MKLKTQRRLEAEQRNAAWSALTPEQQLSHLDRLGLAAAKQRAKIQKVIDNRKEKQS